MNVVEAGTASTREDAIREAGRMNVETGRSRNSIEST